MAIEDTVPGRLARWVSAAEPDWDAIYAEQLPRVYNFSVADRRSAGG